MLMTRVHIAGPVEWLIQRCSRCSCILSDARDAMSVDGVGLRPWAEGAFVGEVQRVRADGSTSEGMLYILMERDAQFGDEVACDRMTQ